MVPLVLWRVNQSDEAMNPPFEDSDAIIATVIKLLRANGEIDAANVLASNKYHIEETGYDNWNGGTYLYTVYLSLPPVDFVSISSSKKQIEGEISACLHQVSESVTNSGFSVKIIPSIIKLSRSDRRIGEGLLSMQDAQDNRLALISLKNRIVDEFLAEHWHEVGVLTNCDDLVDGHDRLLRSLHWRDPDYAGNALSVLKSIVERSNNNLKIIAQYLNEKFPPKGINISSNPKGGKSILFIPQVFQIPDDDAVDHQLVSVMMPFQAQFSPVYEAIQGAIVSAGCRCERADNVWEHSVLVQDIFSLIWRSAIVVCDFSGKNPNVFYETGIAHTLGKHVIPLAQSADDVPFDLRHHRYIPYLNNAEGRRDLASRLTDRVRYLSSHNRTLPWQRRRPP